MILYNNKFPLDLALYFTSNGNILFPQFKLFFNAFSFIGSVTFSFYKFIRLKNTVFFNTPKT